MHVVYHWIMGLATREAALFDIASPRDAVQIDSYSGALLSAHMHVNAWLCVERGNGAFKPPQGEGISFAPGNITGEFVAPLLSRLLNMYLGNDAGK